MDKKKIAFIIILIFVISTFSYAVYPRQQQQQPSDDTDNNDNQNETDEPDQNNTEPPVVKFYMNTFTFDQTTAKLDGEVTQYKITFHDDDIFSYDMYIHYQLSSAGSVFYLIYLTNGTYTTALHLSGESSGRLLDLTTFRKHRMIGKGANLEGNVSEYNSTSVSKNETWYLTVAVARSINETLTIRFNTLKTSMEIQPLLRNNNVTLSSAIDADYKDAGFLKRYRGFSMLGIGFSICYADLTFPVQHGGIICTDMRNQKQGFVYIGTNWSEIWMNGRTETPGYASILISSTDEKGIKNWRVYSEALGYPRKISLLTMVVDVNPYSSIQLNDWDLNHTKTLSEKIIQRNMIRIQKLFTGLLTINAFGFNLTWNLLKPFVIKFLEKRPLRVERRQEAILWIIDLFKK